MRHIPTIWEYVAVKVINQLSSISFGDLALISANYMSLLAGEKDNEAELRARGYSEEQLKTVLAKQPKVHTKIMGLVFTKPIVKFVYPLMGYSLLLLENYERGNLPYAGSVSEQPAQAMEILSLLQAIKMNFQNEQLNKRQ